MTEEMDLMNKYGVRHARKLTEIKMDDDTHVLYNRSDIIFDQELAREVNCSDTRSATGTKINDADIKAANANGNKIDDAGVDLSYKRLLQALPTSYQYHLFVCSSSDDYGIVIPIIREIEAAYQANCCYGDRNFMPGSSIFDAIIEGLDNSEKVVVMLSPNFTKSSFCRFALNQALMKSKSTGLNSVIPVLLKECDVQLELKPIQYIDATLPNMTVTDIARRIVMALTQPDVPGQSDRDRKQIAKLLPRRYLEEDLRRVPERSIIGRLADNFGSIYNWMRRKFSQFASASSMTESHPADSESSAKHDTAHFGERPNDDNTQGPTDNFGVTQYANPKNLPYERRIEFRHYLDDLDFKRILKNYPMLQPNSTLETLFKSNFQQSMPLLLYLIELFLGERKTVLAKLILCHICLKIKEEHGKNCIEIYPAYKMEHKLLPDIVMLEQNRNLGSMENYHGVRMYRRRYDFVSKEAEIVMNSDNIQENLLSLSEREEIQKVINRCKLTDKHSNITIISSCPYRSKRRGKELEKQKCIVIYCLLKGYIPFGEEPFPQSIDGIPIDVREGYFELGMNGTRDHDVLMSDAPRLLLPKGPRSIDCNEHLLIGTGIGPTNSSGRGTLGGFVRLHDGSMGFLTCAHLLPRGNGSKVSQPADGDISYGNWSSCECGVVMDHVFNPGAADQTGIDAAVVKITDTNRLPSDGSFVHITPDQIRFAGFDTTKFQKGKILKLNEITDENRDKCVFKVGSETGLTKGVVHQNGIYCRQVTLEMKLPDENRNSCYFFNQVEVLSITATARRFFEAGDSGSLVFIRLPELHCVGLAIGHTSYGSCIVTPIEYVLEKTGVEFVDFTVGRH